MAKSEGIVLRAQPRELKGKSVKQLRRAGITPIVVYGPKSEPVALQTSSKDLVNVLHRAGGTQLVAIDVEGEPAPRMTLAKEVQRHTTKLMPIHADFIEVVMDELIMKEVPLMFVGESPALKAGGQLATPVDRVLVRALPAYLPAHIEVDVSGLEAIGDVVHASALDLPAGVEMIDPEFVVARIEGGRSAAEEEAAESAAEAEAAAEAAEEAAPAEAAGDDEAEE